MTSLEQHHSGDGDNIGRDKIINEIKSLAPSDLVAPMDLVFESLRRKNKSTAKTQLAVLKAIAQRDPESAALVEVISIYGGLVQAQDQAVAWTTVARIVSRTTNPIIRDVCQAALLQLSYKSTRAEEAIDLYLSEDLPGDYSRESYLRYYANEDQLRAAVKSFPSEGVLTGAVEGAFRLHAENMAVELATRLNSHYSSYNARVLLAVATGVALNPDFGGKHFWLQPPEVKERIDRLRDMAIQLLEESSTDGRTHDICCSILKIYEYQSTELLEALKKHVQHLDSTKSDVIARCKALAGDDTCLPKAESEFKSAFEDPQKRREWCRRFLESFTHQLEDVSPFLNLANPAELAEWLGDKKMGHVRGAPYHPQTQGKIERWHQTLKNRILLDNYFFPADLEAQIEAFVDHYNHQRYHESINNLTPADVYFGRGQAILKQRERIKRKTMETRRLQYRKYAA